MLLYHYKQLTACISEGEQIESKVNSNKKEWLTKEEEVPTTTVTLDGYFIHNNANYK
jgi:hypothetical protein